MVEWKAGHLECNLIIAPNGHMMRYYSGSIHDQIFDTASIWPLLANETFRAGTVSQVLHYILIMRTLFLQNVCCLFCREDGSSASLERALPFNSLQARPTLKNVLKVSRLSIFGNGSRSSY